MVSKIGYQPYTCSLESSRRDGRWLKNCLPHIDMVLTQLKTVQLFSLLIFFVLVYLFIFLEIISVLSPNPTFEISFSSVFIF